MWRKENFSFRCNYQIIFGTVMSKIPNTRVMQFLAKMFGWRMVRASPVNNRDWNDVFRHKFNFQFPQSSILNASVFNYQLLN